MRTLNVDSGTVASRVVVTATPQMPVTAAAQLMRDHHVGTLVVVESNDAAARPVGLVTDRDLVVEVLAQAVDPKLLTVGDVMSATPVTVGEKAPLYDAIGVMRQHGVRRLIVVDGAQRLAGLLAMDDVVAVLAEELSGLARTADAEIRAERARRRPVGSAV
jgi:CBS domain-containing protein